ncbi:pyrokinin-1 receptor-like isoform X1 [Harmonia axyridis]|uniref:pyrokinin-1 receptor-like isoform X1 n=1 Tax=Harmonia axyridis TaxID=115357 RepID=UPI001E279394|nr:pyrokinin-1 receptor-like isoform X1 [Harmonia axyridis]
MHENIELNSTYTRAEDLYSAYLSNNYSDIFLFSNYSSSNFNISNFPILPANWGPKRDPLEIVIPITVIYVITFFSGLVGNISTCIVIAKNKSMHTATNYYLFSLAISDLLLLISGLPPEIYYVWSKYPYIFGEVFCILQGFAAETSANATVLTITAFTVERYVAICHPFLSHTLSKLNRAVKFIVAIWVVALCLAIPPAMGFGVVCEQINGTIIDEHCVCMVKRQVIPHAFEISTCVFFVAPMSLITVLYILIGLQLHKSTVGPSRGNSVKMKYKVYKPVTTYGNAQAQAVVVLNEPGSEKAVVKNHNDDDGRKNFAKNAQAAKHVVKMLVAVVVTFFICWAPFHAQRLLAIYGERSSSRTIKAYQTLTYVSGVLYYLSTTVNPLLYNIMSHKFREAFKNTFKQCFSRHLMARDPAGGRCYANLSGRSSQVNSHSNTDSYSRQSSLRYLDAEMARLHDHRRPLVVSFKRKGATTSPYRGRRADKGEQTFDGDFPEMRDQRMIGNLDIGLEKKLSILEKKIPEETMTAHLTYVEVHNLQPTHICPLSISHLKSIDTLKTENHHRRRRNNHSRSLNCDLTIDSDSALSKSCTMPDIGKKKKTVEVIDSCKSREKSDLVGYESMEKQKEYLCVSSILLSRANTPLINVN